MKNISLLVIMMFLPMLCIGYEHADWVDIFRKSAKECRLAALRSESQLKSVEAKELNDEAIRFSLRALIVCGDCIDRDQILKEFLEYHTFKITIEG